MRGKPKCSVIAIAPRLQRQRARTLCPLYLLTRNVDVVAGDLAAISHHEDEGYHLGMLLPNFIQTSLNLHSNLHL